MSFSDTSPNFPCKAMSIIAVTAKQPLALKRLLNPPADAWNPEENVDSSRPLQNQINGHYGWAVTYRKPKNDKTARTTTTKPTM